MTRTLWKFSSYKRFTTSASLFSLALAFMVFISLLTTSFAHAVSPFDNAIRNTTTLSLISVNGTQNISVANGATKTWKDYAFEATCGGAFESAYNSGKYAVSQVVDPVYSAFPSGTYGTYVTITYPGLGTLGNMSFDYQNNDQTALAFYSPGGGSIGLTQMTLYVQNDGTVRTSCRGEVSVGIASSSGNIGPNSSNPVNIYLYVLKGLPITYPEGYEGQFPSDGAEPSTATPDVEVTSGNNPNVKAIDKNFNTFDDVPFLCSDNLAPVWNYEIFDNEDTMIISGQLSSTGTLAETVPQNDFYMLVSWYSCAENPQFNRQTRTYFEVGEKVYSPYKPDLNIVSATGWRLIIQDKNFNTFDPVPFTCLSETTPIIHYQLFQRVSGSDVLLTSGQMSPTVQFTYTLPNVASHFSFTAYYDCGQNDLEFNQTSVLDFEMNAYGGQVLACGDDIAGFFCSFNKQVNFGIFSTTFQGLVAVITKMQDVSPTCNTNWATQTNFQSNIIPVQNMPQEVCNNANLLFIAPNAKFHVVSTWLNVFLQGATVLLLVFGLLSIFGFRVRLSSPIGEGEDNGIRSDIATSSSISRHKTPYVKGKNDRG